MSTTLTGKSLKCVIPLDPAELAVMRVPDGVPRVVLHIRTPDRTVTVDLSAKSVRKAVGTIEASGVGEVVCFVQGKLVAGDQVAEAGLVAQAKVKPAAAA